MRGDGGKIDVLDGSALKALSTELNSSKYAIDAHNRSIEKLGNLSELPKLCSLDVSFNKLTSLRNVSTARELRELKIYNNKLTNTVGLKANLNLEGLIMNDNQIEEISSDFSALAKLKNLGLNGNRISVVQNLRGCRLLVHLDLGRNFLKGAAAQGLDALVNLEQLNLTGNQLSSVGNLAHLSKLEELNLSENKLTALQGILPPNLLVLRVNGNQLSDFNGIVAPLAKLNELYAHDNSIADLDILPNRCPQLESLDLRNNQISSSIQISTLAKCESLQDIWLHGNPCCFSDSYLIDVATALPGLKTLDSFTDSQLHSHLEKLKSGVISQDELLRSARAATPSFRPGSAASRPGSGIRDRPITPSGRPATRDAAPVFHTPSARIGNMTKLTSEADLAKAQQEVRDRLQKMKQLLHRVDSKADDTATPDRTEKIEKLQQSMAVHRNTPVGMPMTPPSVKTSDSGFHQTGDTRPMVEKGSGRTERFPKIVHRARTVQSLIRRSCVDAGTDPIDSLMGNNQPATPPSPGRGCEIETQTTLPPAPSSISKSTALLQQLGLEFQTPVDNHPQQNDEENVALSDGMSEGVESSGNQWEPEQDGVAIEAEMRMFLLQHVTEGTVSTGSHEKPEDQPEDDIDPANFWSDSPRLDPIKTAEQRKPPTSLSRTGYRTFRMPSRPTSSGV